MSDLIINDYGKGSGKSFQFIVMEIIVSSLQNLGTTLELAQAG